MSDNQRRNADELLERAIDALRHQPADDVPPEHLQAATIQALHDLAKDPRPRADKQERKFPMLRLTRAGGATAAALVIGLLVVTFLLSGLGSSFTFADVLDKLAQSRSVHFIARYQVDGTDVQKSRMWIQDDIVRHQVSDYLVVVIDTNQRKGIQLDAHRKIVEELDLAGQIPAEELSNPIEQLRNLKEQPDVRVTQLPDETVDQRTCRVYRVDGATALSMRGQWTIWVDAETTLPVQMQIEDDNMSATFEQMVWDEQLDPSLFSLTAPEGYVFERPIAAEIRTGQITYHVGRDFFSIQPDGSRPLRQFLPQSPGAGMVSSNKSELSPDGRYLAMAFPAQRDEGLYPPERILLWDRTQPERAPVEVYAHPGAELSHWRFSADGKRLYVAWWKQLPDKNWPHGIGADFVDLETGKRSPMELPVYTSGDGEALPMVFADVSPGGLTYLVVGRHLQLISTSGEPLRELTTGDLRVDAHSVRFSPDGRHALYVTSQRGVGYQLCKVAVAGGEPQIVVPAGQFAGIRARWSTDGQRIAFTCRIHDPNHQRRFGNEAYLKIVNADGTGLETVISEKAHPDASSLELTAWR